MSDRKDNIRAMIDNIVDDNSEQADINFHNASTDIVKSLMGIPTEAEYEDVEEYEEVDIDVDAVDTPDADDGVDFD